MNLISQTGQEISPFKAPEIVFFLYDCNVGEFAFDVRAFQAVRERLPSSGRQRAINTFLRAGWEKNVRFHSVLFDFMP